MKYWGYADESERILIYNHELRVVEVPAPRSTKQEASRPQEEVLGN
jgi:hypothetical protein